MVSRKGLRFHAFGLTLAVLLGAAASASGAKLGSTWVRTFSAGEQDRDNFHLRIARRLADGSLLAVVSQGFGAGAFRFGVDGALLSTATFSSPGILSAAAADALGSVVLVSGGTDYVTNLVVMKFDGATGKPVWASPARIQAARGFAPVAAAIGPSGNVFVAASVLQGVPYGIFWAAFCYDGRTGALLWGPQIYGDGVTFGSGPVDVGVDPAGDVVVTGFAPVSDHALWESIKYRGATGAVAWGPVKIGAASTAPPPTVCPGSCYAPPTFAKSAFDRKGNVFLAVSSFTAPYAQAWLTAKYDGATGRILWGPVSHKTGSEVDFDVPSTVAVDGNGDVVVGGSVLASPYSDYSDAKLSVNELVKYRGDTGAKAWGPVVVSSDISSLSFDGGGQVVVAGSAYDRSGGRSKWSTAKFDGRSGNLLWSQPVDPEGPTAFLGASFAVVGPDGSVTSLGSRYVRYGVEQYPELRAVNYEGSNGSVLWGPISATNTGASTWPLALLVDGHGDAILVTSSGGPGAILKYSSDGRDLWGPVRFSRGSSETGWPAVAGLDPNGDVVVCRSSLVGKYSGSNGKVLWETPPPGGLDRFLGVRTDSAGNVLTVASSNYGWTALKFQVTTGELQWSSSFWPIPSSPGGPVDFGVDPKGDVFVTGYQWENERTMWVTFKYSGTTGDPLWGPLLYRSPHFGSEVPGKVLVDGNGDLIVTGIAGGTGTSRKTIKYSGKDGALVWGPSEQGIGRAGVGAPSAVALDAAADIFIVGGHSPQSPSDYPGVWSIVKIRGKTGELVWGPKDIPATRSGTVAIALDAKGDPAVACAVREGGPDELMLVGYDSATGAVLLGPELHVVGGNSQIAQIVLSGSDVVVSGGSGRLAFTIRYGTTLGIATLQEDLAPVPFLCGDSFSSAFNATNGKLPVSWEISSGSPPPGLDLNPFTGTMTGTFAGSGSFTFAVRVRDAVGSEAERTYTIDVLDGGPNLQIQAIAREGCLPGQYTLSVPETFASYAWLPGDETTPEITVCPFEPTIYSVTVTEASGCRRRGSIELAPFKIELVPRAPLELPPRQNRRR